MQTPVWEKYEIFRRQHGFEPLAPMREITLTTPEMVEKYKSEFPNARIGYTIFIRRRLKAEIRNGGIVFIPREDDDEN
jgi:hypothetical protein